MDEKSIVLVGLGPHSKRIYMHLFVKYQLAPKLIIDLESKADDVNMYLSNNKMSIECLFIPDKEKDVEFLYEETKKKIKTQIAALNITHAIISTEPKAHNAYINFFLDNKINILVDKPLTAPINVCNDEGKADQIEKEYSKIIQKYLKVKKEDGIILDIQCQRRWHIGYRYIYNELKEVVKKYGVPITSIQVTHCDGMWNMPDEFANRENHPYKYGYGKLFHSGYHFVDLVSWLTSVNDILPDLKFDMSETYASAVRPNDFLRIIDNNFYKNILKTNKFDTVFENADYKYYGEIDVYSIIRFLNNHNVITTATVNLMQDGFSRRSWVDLPEDTYKGNGRVRHEYVNIEVGPLMNIQVHSYQAKEIKDRNLGDLCSIGECEHFDIYIFRNIDIIGGKLFQKISISDLLKNSEIGKFIGYNEFAREKCFLDFINKKSNGMQIFAHHRGIQMMRDMYKSICAGTNGDKCLITSKL